jgi:hypothetical protein
MQSNDLKKKAQAREIVLSIIVMGALCFMIYSLFISAKKKQQIDLEDKLTQITADGDAIEKENTELKKKIDEQKRLDIIQPTPQQATASKNPRVQMIQGKLKPDYIDVSEFLNAVTKPEFRMSLEIQSLNYSDQKKEKGYSSTRFNVIARGQFGTAVDFINKLESVKAMVAIDKINIDVDKDDNKLVTLELGGSFYKMEDSNG